MAGRKIMAVEVYWMGGSDVNVANGTKDADAGYRRFGAIWPVPRVKRTSSSTGESVGACEGSRETSRQRGDHLYPRNGNGWIVNVLCAQSRNGFPYLRDGTFWVTGSSRSRPYGAANEPLLGRPIPVQGYRAEAV